MFVSFNKEATIAIIAINFSDSPLRENDMNIDFILTSTVTVMPRAGGIQYHIKSLYRSFQSGLFSSINLNFQALFQCFSCFSLAIAAAIFGVIS
jgi:hypothetical protein